MIIQPATLAALEAHFLESIPLARAMRLEVESGDDRQLVLCAPLAPNINDKGCAFGGSLASLMTLACWGLATLQLGTHGLRGDIFVGRSEVAYRKPVWRDFRLVARALDTHAWDAFAQDFTQRGKARIDLQCQADEIDGETACAGLQARFVAKHSAPDVPARPI